MIEDLARWRRARDLAGNRRAGSWARGESRRVQRAFLRANWLRFGILVVVVVVGAGIVAQFIPSRFLAGMVWGAGLTGAALGVWTLTIQLTGTAATMMGDDSEQWTAQELRSTRRAGWRLVNHVSLQSRDVDHVLLGPGGVYALETKWSSTSWRSASGRQRLNRAVEQVTAGARSLRLWQRTGVEPVVVIWGADASQLHPTTVDGVLVVPGSQLKLWARSLPGGVLAPGRVEEIWTLLDAYLVKRDVHEQASHPTPRALTDWVARGGVAVGALSVGLTVVGALVR